MGIKAKAVSGAKVVKDKVKETVAKVTAGKKKTAVEDKVDQARAAVKRTVAKERE